MGLGSTAILLLSILLVAVIIIASAEELYVFSKYCLAKVTGRHGTTEMAATLRKEGRGYLEESLSANEQIVGRFYFHWMVWLPLALYLVLTALSMGIAAPLAIYEFLRVRAIDQGVTSKRLVLKRGVIGRKTDEMQLASVETVEIAQSALGRVLDYGSINVTGRGTGSLSFKKIRNPIAAKKTIENLGQP